jgi:hypothetical protein
VFFADLESEVIFEVAEALRVPVLVLTVLALGVVLVELGGFAVELTRRRRRDLARLRSVTEQTRKVLADGGGSERAQQTLARSPGARRWPRRCMCSSASGASRTATA